MKNKRKIPNQNLSKLIPRQAANRNNQQEDQPIQHEDQQADQANQNIQRLRDLSANKFSDANEFNRALADFMIEIYEQLKELNQCIKNLEVQNFTNLPNHVQRHEMILNRISNSFIPKKNQGT